MSDKLDRDTLFKKLRARPENKVSSVTAVVPPANSRSIEVSVMAEL